MKRQASSPYILGSTPLYGNKSSSLNKNDKRKSPNNILTQVSNLNYHSKSGSKASPLGTGTKSSHNRDYSHNKSKQAIPRSISSKKIHPINQTILESTTHLNTLNKSTSSKKIKRTSKASSK